MIFSENRKQDEPFISKNRRIRWKGPKKNEARERQDLKQEGLYFGVLDFAKPTLSF